jgi:PKD repeat protein
MAAGLVVAAPAAIAAGVAAVPRPDHVVIVVDENHSSGGVIGNPNAPYINSLAASGANMTGFFAETHPSQPNYVAMYSGDTQGVTDDSCPHTFSTPNLGAQLATAGLGFTGYSEGLPSVGYTGCASGKYARKHNPWSDFSNVATSANQPFSAFPTDYSTLPAVSYVIPNLDNDMHDGTVAQGDTWLQNNLSGYITWAQTHNSVFVLTFDEDDGSQANQIATIITGQRIATGNYPEHVNHYNLLRTIEDGFGLPGLGAAATATPLLDIWTQPSGDQPPVAEFTTDCSAGLTCSFDSTPSSDPDGSITSYSWDFGDGTTGTGQTPSHTYVGGGAKSVTLTVVDNQGAATSITHTANPVAPAGSPFVADTFNRTVRNAWGPADTGGAWSTSGATTNFTVDPGKATILLPKAGAGPATWVGPAVTDADVSPVFSVSKLPVGNSVYATINGRRIDATNYYGATVFVNADGSVNLNLNRTVAGAGTVLGSTKVTGLTVTAGMSLQARLQVTGTSPTTLRARVWASSTAEPTTWRLTATDASAALQAPGQTGLVTYLPSSVTNAPLSLNFSGFTARPTTTGTNLSPTAAFTSSCTQLSCSFNGSSSSDPDGTIAGYAWTFGDGSTGTGATLTHAYVTANDYVVTLTVTDNAGAAATVSHTVTATSPPPNQPPVARFTSSCTALVCSFDGSASSDPEDVTVASYSWDFGDPADTTGATTATPSHTYAIAGTYTVTLTVTDSDGAQASVNHAVTVSAGSTAFVSDTFGRTVSNGWGTADVGGAWSIVGKAARYAVGSGAGSMSFPTPGVQLETFVGPATTDADVVADLALDKVPAGAPVYISLVGRRVSTGNTYVGKVQIQTNGQLLLRLNRLVGGTESQLAGPLTLPGITYTAGMRLSMRVQVTGTSPTTIRARAWSAAASEPASWQLSATDSSAGLQQAGAVGAVVFVPSASTITPLQASYSRFVATPTG